MLGQTPLLPDGPQHSGMPPSLVLNMPKGEADIGGDRSPKDANPIDLHVGTRIRLRRTLMGMSQERLADALGLSFQQVQKYERGVNRVGASRLYEISRVLDVPIAFFYDDMQESTGGAARVFQGVGSLTAAQGSFGDDMLTWRETLELVRAYYRIADIDVRKRVVELVASLGHEAPR